jgi:hypothetical protein
LRISIGWVYPIGILSTYILFVMEYFLRRYLAGSGLYLPRMPIISVMLVSLFFIILGIIQWFRYRNWIYPVLGFLLGITTSQVGFIYSGFAPVFKFTYFACFFIMILFVVINWRPIYSHERFELNSRRLFRLAAERIFETSNGFTERPFAGGNIESGRDELLGFVRFLHGSYVIRPFYLEQHAALAFSMNKSLMVIRDPGEVSHVRIDYDGTVTVRISEKDYRDYRERLSFDQLCSSTAGVFIRFFDYYHAGLESRIITELKSAK